MCPAGDHQYPRIRLIARVCFVVARLLRISASVRTAAVSHPRNEAFLPLDALDLSNFTSHFTVDHVQQWKAAGVGLAIIQLIGGVRLSGDDCATQILTCLEGGLAVDCYLFPGNDGLPLSTAQRLALVPATVQPSIRQMWVDIEPANTNPTQPAINTAMSHCDIWAPHQRTGGYSALWVASKLGWLPWPWPTRKQWLVNATGVPNLGGTFNGTNLHVLTQYAEDVILAGVSGMDRSVLSDEEATAVTQWLAKGDAAVALDPVPQKYLDLGWTDWRTVAINLQGIADALGPQVTDAQAALAKCLAQTPLRSAADAALIAQLEQHLAQIAELAKPIAS